MTDYPTIIFASLLIFCYGLISRVSERSPISAPMVFAGIGMLAGPLALDLFELQLNATVVRLIAEITLVLILFVDASTVNLRTLRTQQQIPIRLLGIGLPLTMALGFAAAVVLIDSKNLWLAAMVALILSPTDAALGQAVVTSERLPVRIRQAINVESGLNDGIALPPILMCLAALSGGQSHGSHPDSWILFMVRQLTLGPIAGVMVGWLGGLLVDEASRRNWMQPTFQRLVAGSLAVLAYAAAETFHGNGFIAAYCAGLFLGTRTHAVRERIQEFGEAEGQQMSLFVFLLFGLAMVPAMVKHWDVEVLCYAILSLTAVRMIPVVLCMRGTGLDAPGAWFIAWFGPRGIASVLYALMAVSKIGVSGYERAFAVITLTVLLSIFLHGLSAVPLTVWYSRYLEGARLGRENHSAG
ncbi:MAG: sodium:proton antiporter [Desulfomonile tiedjei]|uniref:Sodium:proton antiporter n=1 Tax=Desulfomonile tiedjei TaxID=2358 RepID=A0A9D6V1C8_9BACT|nr:sodium:proton antiporter [Desulfomonile tiedjei]